MVQLKHTAIISSLLSISLGFFIVVASAKSTREEPLPDTAKLSDRSDSLAAPNHVRARVSRSTITCKIAAPRDFVWKILTDFPNYPRYFSKIESCHVTKQEGDLVFIESFLKQQMFVSERCQHTVNDLSCRPEHLSWKLLDGNFRHVEGSWQLQAVDNGNRCYITYTLQVDAGPVIPSPLASFALHLVQHDIVESLKKSAEKAYGEEHPSTAERIVQTQDRHS